MEVFGQNDRISNMELWTLMLVFILGSSMTLPIGYAAGHDSWISAIIGTIAGLGINSIYIILCMKFPRKSWVEIAQVLLVSWIGKLVGLLYTWYSFYLGAYVLRNFTDFTVTSLLPRTPTIVISFIMISTAVWTVSKGIEVIVRSSIIFILFLVIQLVLYGVLLIPEMDPKNMFPILESGWTPILKGAGQIATIPLGETVVFAMLISYVNRTSAAKKTVLTVIGTAGVMLIYTCFINIFTLGELVSQQIFPTYTSTMYVAVGNFFERIEPLASIIWIFGEFAKLSVCVLVSALALSQTIGSRNYRFYLFPLGLMLLELSLFLHPNQLDLMAYIKNIWPIYSIPFQVIIPLTMLMVYFVKRKTIKHLN